MNDTLEWVEIEPINGARTYVLCLNGVPISADEIDEGESDIWDS